MEIAHDDGSKHSLLNVALLRPDRQKHPVSANVKVKKGSRGKEGGRRRETMMESIGRINPLKR